jgi:hypothetical protein
MILLHERSQRGDTAIDRANPDPIGTWIIDPAQSSVSLARRKLGRWTITGRLHCFGVIHLDDLPSVGVIEFGQPSGLPVLTIALDPARVEPHDADPDTVLGGPGVGEVGRHRWWTLRSESLQIQRSGIWRVMATLITYGSTALVELHLEVDQEASSADWLALRGGGLLDRRAFGIASPASTFSAQIRLDLAVRARRAGSQTRTE